MSQNDILVTQVQCRPLDNKNTQNIMWNTKIQAPQPIFNFGFHVPGFQIVQVLKSPI